MIAHERRKKEEQRRKAAMQDPQDIPPIVKYATPELVQLSDGPSAMWYCDAFLSEAEATSIEEAIRTGHTPAEWISLTKRRLLNLGGVPHPDGMLGELLPQWLQPVLDRLTSTGAFPNGLPNQCLLNEYGIGQGIDPHCDGPLFESRAAVLSLCSPALLRFVEASRQHAPEEAESERGSGRPWHSRTLASVFMRPGSLVVFADEAYERLMHGVADVAEEVVQQHTLNQALAGVSEGKKVARGNRLSLTLRTVREVAVPAGEFLQPSQQAEAARRRAWWARAISEKKK